MKCRAKLCFSNDKACLINREHSGQAVTRVQGCQVSAKHLFAPRSQKTFRETETCALEKEWRKNRERGWLLKTDHVVHAEADVQYA